MNLSILIPSLSRRSAYLSRLLSVLELQITLGVELLIDIDAGEKGRGAKRNALLRQATGDYVCFVDDDDLVTGDYVEQILVGIRKGVDVVSIRGQQFKNGELWRYFRDEPGKPFGFIEIDGQPIIQFGIQHLDAIRREIALSVGFQDIKFGEDRYFGNGVSDSGKVKTWHLVPSDVYLYYFRSVKEA